ncbi:hypothetical protein ACFXAZ_31145 [Streptomyces sp. NPDC059477]|uniref:hypothetical protein n=1 Tax=Streptomyces sp. NPDC059477 TaxID=3346847 RepID=UPI0036CAC56C
MPRGRHRHSPPLHRLLPPSVIAGVAVVCAIGPWVLSETTVLRGLAAVAALTAVAGAVVMRRWDAQAGKAVADLTRVRVSEEWRHEERVAELESDLDESRELRGKLEQRLRAKRAELTGLRNEHAALLRRYATAETERATALEGRRLLEIEAGEPVNALPSGKAEHSGKAAAPAGTDAASESAGSADAPDAADALSDTPALFSPEGTQLFLRARAALGRLEKREQESGQESEQERGQGKGALAEGEGVPVADAVADAALDAVARADASEGDSGTDPDPDPDSTDPDPNGRGPGGDSTDEAGAQDSGAEARSDIDGAVEAPSAAEMPGVEAPAVDAPAVDAPAVGTPVPARAAVPAQGSRSARAEASVPRPGLAAGGDAEAAQEDEAQGKHRAADAREHAVASSTTHAQSDAALVAETRPALPAHQPTGHFTVPTAVAVVPPTPARRPSVEGGFDFFGTKQEDEAGVDFVDIAMEHSVQDEDLADVVGQEALDARKAQAEGEFERAGERADGIDAPVIDLTAHDETEQIDVQGLRSAVS